MCQLSKRDMSKRDRCELEPLMASDTTWASGDAVRARPTTHTAASNGPPRSGSGWRYFGGLGRQRLVASVGSLHTFGQHLGSELDLVLEAIGAERSDLAAREGATVEHGHGGILLHFSNKVARSPMFMRSRWCARGSPQRELPGSTIENG